MRSLLLIGWLNYRIAENKFVVFYSCKIIGLIFAVRQTRVAMSPYFQDTCEGMPFRKDLGMFLRVAPVNSLEKIKSPHVNCKHIKNR